MNKKMKMCSMLLGLALFAACSSDDDVVTPQPKSYPLTIEVSENPLIPEGGAASAPATRAAITTITSLKEFKLDYVYGSAHTTGGAAIIAQTTDGKWEPKTGSTTGWPSDAATHDDEVAWYAYTNGSFNLNGGSPYISFEGEEYADAQHDLLVATTANKWSICQGLLSFTFDHACSALRFYVKKSTNLNTYTFKVKCIKLRNVINQGRYMLATNTWNEGSYRTEYTLFQSNDYIELGPTDYIPIYGTYSSESEPYLFLIPQTLTAWDTTTAIADATTQSYLEIECSINNTAYTAYIPFAASLEKGIKRDVKINIGKNSLYSGPNTKIINS